MNVNSNTNKNNKLIQLNQYKAEQNESFNQTKQLMLKQQNDINVQLNKDVKE